MSQQRHPKTLDCDFYAIALPEPACQFESGEYMSADHAESPSAGNVVIVWPKADGISPCIARPAFAVPMQVLLQAKTSDPMVTLSPTIAAFRYQPNWLQSLGISSPSQKSVFIVRSFVFPAERSSFDRIDLSFINRRQITILVAFWNAEVFAVVTLFGPIVDSFFLVRLETQPV